MNTSQLTMTTNAAGATQPVTTDDITITTFRRTADGFTYTGQIGTLEFTGCAGGILNAGMMSEFHAREHALTEMMRGAMMRAWKGEA